MSTRRTRRKERLRELRQEERRASFESEYFQYALYGLVGAGVAFLLYGPVGLGGSALLGAALGGYLWLSARSRRDEEPEAPQAEPTYEDELERRQNEDRTLR